MTNRIKTVQHPRLILLACSNSRRISEIISDILNFCSYNTCINDFSENTDFVIENEDYAGVRSEGVIADTVLFDAKTEALAEKTDQFRNKVTAYENVADEAGDIMTYSADNYGADVTCRNISESGDTVTFDIVGNGILSRINLDKNQYSVDEVLACTGVLLAAGLPLASILGFFNNEEGC